MHLSLKPLKVSDYSFHFLLSPSKISIARQAQASEMGGQHEAGGVDPKSTSVPVQRAFYRRLLWYTMGHPLPEEHSHPDCFPFLWRGMYMSCLFFFSPSISSSMKIFRNFTLQTFSASGRCALVRREEFLVCNKPDRLIWVTGNFLPIAVSV